ncbi:4-hydroxy-tetrahydrodipicolinate reductase [Jannaschia sp. Os4]|uniref:4-hydroxy-tetrahydrodipicolinate reductase n=1 Tax=Jannaschia sp. Os4 TaxID=2807617 RepID=UPI0019398F6E|nr:4-hydroxy-tetrahydrodipicolinate reductase [Jannaschia sp. Os4]MBM2574798.1 4-hydroxy-tetrahydrodipicolinate reductase [Jannaschia sp. Os4]
MTNVVIAGASGRMGQVLARLVREADDLTLLGGTDAPGGDWIGRDLGEAMGAGTWGVPVTDDPIELVKDAQAVIDFTAPAATVALSEICAQARCTHVVGTTGLAPEDIGALDRAARHAVVVRAGNMSLGVNLLTQLVAQVARALGEEYDVEVVEAHHRHKVDAPSGTALMLGEAAAEGRGVMLADVADRGRDGITGARAKGAIGFHAIRGGDVVGDHEVIFAGDGERVVVGHKASDRTVFARGALRAARWGQDQAPGHYDMIDVLGLR